MSTPRITTRIPLPEPLDYAHVAFSHDRRRGVIVGSRTGRLWMLEIDPARRACQVHPLPLSVPRHVDEEGWMVHHMSGSQALDRLLLWTDEPRVLAIPAGQVVAELGRPPGRAVCLSPSGRWAISLDEGIGATMYLDAAVPRWTETPEFHAWEQGGVLVGLLLDHVDTVVAMPCADAVEDDEEFWIAAGCYGFVVTHRVEAYPAWGELRRIAGRSRDLGGLVYDPTELLPPGRQHVFVWHGYGTGIAAIDPATGEQHHGWIRGPRKQPYGFVSGVVASGDAPLAWGHSKDGAFLWRVGEPPVLFAKSDELPLALFPGALLALSPTGDELWWMDLPPA